VETGDNSTVVTFSQTAGAGSVTGLGNATASSGVASLTVTGNAAGSVTVQAAKTGLASDTSTFTVNPGALDHFVFSAASPQTDGLAFSGTDTLTAKDVNGNTITSFDASANNVTISTTLSGTVGGIHGSNVLNQAADFTSGVADLSSLGLGMQYTGTTATGTFPATSPTR